MTDYERVLEKTEQHLIALKAAGIRFLGVQPETLAGLHEPVARPASLAVHQPLAEPIRAAARVEEVVVIASPEGLKPAKDKEAAMRELREKAMVCQKCPHLAGSRKNVVFGVGDINAKLMFVGEAPGADEDQAGEPFGGAAGQLLTRIIKAMGLSRETVYIANILKCRPDTPGQSSGNRKPSGDEMKTCLPYLLEQIELIRPEIMGAGSHGH